VFFCAVLVKSRRADVEPCWGQVVGWSWKHVGFNLGREILAEKNRGNGGSVCCGVLIQAASTTTEGCKVSAVNPNQSWSLEKALKKSSRNLGLECRPRCSSCDANKINQLRRQKHSNKQFHRHARDRMNWKPKVFVKDLGISGFEPAVRLMRALEHIKRKIGNAQVGSFEVVTSDRPGVGLSSEKL
jgi:hypothetical protein